MPWTVGFRYIRQLLDYFLRRYLGTEGLVRGAKAVDSEFFTLNYTSMSNIRQLTMSQPVLPSPSREFI